MFGFPLFDDFIYINMSEVFLFLDKSENRVKKRKLNRNFKSKNGHGPGNSRHV